MVFDHCEAMSQGLPNLIGEVQKPVNFKKLQEKYRQRATAF